MLLFFFSYFGNNIVEYGDVIIIKKSIETVEDIESIDSKFVKPIDYSNVLSLSNLSVQEKKQKFIELILPAILISKYKCKQELMKIDVLSKKKKFTQQEQEYLAKMMKTYRAKDILDLKSRLVTHPTSVVLAQASIESGWGTSRFFIEGRNIFGVWSFHEDEPRIQTKGTRNGKYMYVKKYETISGSIDDYFKTLARGEVFADFRRNRTITQNPYEIIKDLDTYCELGEKYVDKLKDQINHNKLEQYDNYEIDSKYLNIQK